MPKQNTSAFNRPPPPQGSVPRVLRVQAEVVVHGAGFRVRDPVGAARAKLIQHVVIGAFYSTKDYYTNYLPLRLSSHCVVALL